MNQIIKIIGFFCFLFVCFCLDLYLFQEIVLLNPFFKFSKNLILSLKYKLTNGTEHLALFIWNIVPVISNAATSRTGELAFGLPVTLGVIDISGIIHSFEHDKSSFTSQLINS